MNPLSFIIPAMLRRLSKRLKVRSSETSHCGRTVKREKRVQKLQTFLKRIIKRSPTHQHIHVFFKGYDYYVCLKKKQNAMLLSAHREIERSAWRQESFITLPDSVLSSLTTGSIGLKTRVNLKCQRKQTHLEMLLTHSLARSAFESILSF